MRAATAVPDHDSMTLLQTTPFSSHPASYRFSPNGQAHARNTWWYSTTKKTWPPLGFADGELNSHREGGIHRSKHTTCEQQQGISNAFLPRNPPYSIETNTRCHNQHHHTNIKPFPKHLSVTSVFFWYPLPGLGLPRRTQNSIPSSLEAFVAFHENYCTPHPHRWGPK